jgi:hypothetical protein
MDCTVWVESVGSERRTEGKRERERERVWCRCSSNRVSAAGQGLPADAQDPPASPGSPSLVLDSAMQTPPRIDNLDLSPALTDATRSFDYSMVIGTDLLGSSWQGPATGGRGDSRASEIVLSDPSDCFGGASDAL